MVSTNEYSDFCLTGRGVTSSCLAETYISIILLLTYVISQFFNSVAYDRINSERSDNLVFKFKRLYCAFLRVLNYALLYVFRFERCIFVC